MPLKRAGKVRIEGLRDLDAALGQFSKGVGRGVLRRALRQAGAPIEQDAAARAPVGSRTSGDPHPGQLARSVETGTKLSRRQKRLARKPPVKTVSGFRSEPSKGVEIYVGAGPLPQAHMNEFGGANNAPRPFLRPAWDANKMKALDTIKRALAEEIAKTAARIAKRLARASDR